MITPNEVIHQSKKFKKIINRIENKFFEQFFATSANAPSDAGGRYIEFEFIHVENLTNPERNALRTEIRNAGWKEFQITESKFDKGDTNFGAIKIRLYYP